MEIVYFKLEEKKSRITSTADYNFLMSKKASKSKAIVPRKDKNKLVNMTDRSSYLSSKAASLEDRLRRTRNSGKNEDGTVVVSLAGGKKINSIELDHKKLGVKKADAEKISNEIIEAANRALERYERSVSKEIDKIINEDVSKD